MGKLFRKVNREDTVRYTTDDGEDFIELRADLTKNEVNRIMSQAPNPEERDIEGNLRFAELFFESTIVRWSATDDEGNPLIPTVEQYRELPFEAGQWIDSQLGSHMGRILGAGAAKIEGEATG